MFEQFIGPLKTSLFILVDYWWSVIPFLLAIISYGAWLNFKKNEYLDSLNWVLLEIKPPRDVEKSPKIAENIFSGLHSIYTSSVSWKGRFFKGKVQDWFSFEIAGNNGEMRFFVRTLEDYRNIVETQIFAQYPDAEIKEADDYIELLPHYLPNDEYDLFGTELVFTQPDVYPIKTYPEFEEPSGGRESETKRTEPLAPLAELISSLDPSEHIWLQLTVRGTGRAWIKGAENELNKILGKEIKVKPDAFSKIVSGAIDTLGAVVPGLSVPPEENKNDKKEKDISKLTPGQKFVLDSIEKKTAKLGFKVGFRFLYIARKENFHRSRVACVVGMFKQFCSHNLNSFKPNKETITSGSGWFSFIFPSGSGIGAKGEALSKKWQIYQNYRDRAFVKKWVILNTEELATLWHLPGAGIKAPLFPRVETKKSQPPSGLPIK